MSNITLYYVDICFYDVEAFGYSRINYLVRWFVMDNNITEPQHVELLTIAIF